MDMLSFGRVRFIEFIGVVAKICDSNTESLKGDSQKTKIKQG